MGSLGIPPIYHHLYNFGNVPVFFSFGARRSELMIEKDGSIKQHWFMDYTFVLSTSVSVTGITTPPASSICGDFEASRGARQVRRSKL